MDAEVARRRGHSGDGGDGGTNTAAHLVQQYDAARTGRKDAPADAATAAAAATDFFGRVRAPKDKVTDKDAIANGNGDDEGVASAQGTWTVGCAIARHSAQGQLSIYRALTLFPCSLVISLLQSPSCVAISSPGSCGVVGFLSSLADTYCPPTPPPPPLDNLPNPLLSLLVLSCLLSGHHARLDWASAHDQVPGRVQVQRGQLVCCAQAGQDEWADVGRDPSETVV